MQEAELLASDRLPGRFGVYAQASQGAAVLRPYEEVTSGGMPDGFAV